jgi:tetratricopeptide (TPR) repeat protein
MSRPWAVAILALALLLAGTVASPAFEDAAALYERGDFRGAITQAEAAMRRGEDSGRLRTLLGWSHYKAGERPQAREQFERALAMAPRDANAFYAWEGLGWIAYHAGDHDRAIAAFAHALRGSPGYHHAHEGLGWAYLARRDYGSAEGHFTAALRANPDGTEARRGLAWVAYHRGDWRRAIDRLREVLRHDERDTVARSGLAWAYLRRGELKAARRAFEDVARREPAWADPLAGLAWIAEREGRTADAKAGFRAAMAKSAAYVNTGEFRQLVAGRAEWRDLWLEVGWALYHQRAFTSAEREFRALLEQSPRNADALRGLGYTLYAVKRFRDAIAALQQSLVVDARLPPVNERVEIPGAPGLHPVVSDATSTLAWSHFQLGQYDEAQRLFREVTQRQPDWADPYSGLGWTLARLGDRAAAAHAFRESLRRLPSHPDARIGLRTLGFER